MVNDSTGNTDHKDDNTMLVANNRTSLVLVRVSLVANNRTSLTFSNITAMSKGGIPVGAARQGVRVVRIQTSHTLNTKFVLWLRYPTHYNRYCCAHNIIRTITLSSFFSLLGVLVVACVIAMVSTRVLQQHIA